MSEHICRRRCEEEGGCQIGSNYAIQNTEEACIATDDRAPTERLFHQSHQLKSTAGAVMYLLRLSQFNPVCHSLLLELASNTHGPTGQRAILHIQLTCAMAQVSMVFSIILQCPVRDVKAMNPLGPEVSVGFV